MSEIKMSDVFDGLVKLRSIDIDDFRSAEEFGREFFVIEDDEYWCCSEEEHMAHAAIAINSYDANQAIISKQAEQIKVLREALSKVCAVNHTHGGSLSVCGSFYYKVSEEVFKSCENALEATKD